MSQSSPTIGANKSGILYRQEDNDAKLALMTHHKGAAAPGYAAAGTIWIDDSATPWKMKFHDGSDWIILAEINATTNAVNFYQGTAAHRVLSHATDSGSANAYDINPVPAVAAYSTGQVVLLKPANTNAAGASTLSVSGLSAKAIKLPGGVNPPAGALQSSGFYILVYDGTQFILTNAVPTASGGVSPGMNGYVISNAADTVNDITVGAGCCTDSTHTMVIRRTSAMTKQLDALWAAGTNQGGRDTGSIADGTWHTFVISDDSGSTTDLLFSQSSTAPTLPSGYTCFRRVGSFLRTSGSIMQFSGSRERSGGQVVYGLATPILDISVSNLGTAGALYTVTVPSGTSSISIMCHANIQAASAGSYVILQSPNPTFATFATPTGNVAPNAVISLAVANQYFSPGIIELMPNATPAIRAVSSVASTTLRLTTIGWVDSRAD